MLGCHTSYRQPATEPATNGDFVGSVGLRPGPVHLAWTGGFYIPLFTMPFRWRREACPSLVVNDISNPSTSESRNMSDALML